MDGKASLYLLDRPEEVYTFTFPDTYVRGIIIGSLLIETVGEVKISCPATQYSIDIDFKGKPFFGGHYNGIKGRIKHREKDILLLSGKWDSVMFVEKPKMKDSKKEFLNVIKLVKQSKKMPDISKQLNNESQKLWTHVTAALKQKNINLATTEKTKLEDEQRHRAKMFKDKKEVHKPDLFTCKANENNWFFKKFNISKHEVGESLLETDVSLVDELYHLD